jgi:hypothetical protein
MKTICAFLLTISALFAFSSDSIQRPLTWGFKLNYEAIRSVPRYIYTAENIKATEFDFTYLNIGFGFQLFEKNQRNYHEISLSRLWFSNHNEGYRTAGANAVDSSAIYRGNSNFQVGLRYSYYLQTSGKKKVKPHRFLLEFPLEVFYHNNNAYWTYSAFDTLSRPSSGYASNVVGFSFGITPHYHYFFGDRAYIDIAIPVAYTGMYSFTYGGDYRSWTDYIEKNGSGYISGFPNTTIIPFSLRISVGIKLHAAKKRKPK